MHNARAGGMPKRAFIYTQISQAGGQEGLGVQCQGAACRDYAVRHDMRRLLRLGGAGAILHSKAVLFEEHVPFTGDFVPLLRRFVWKSMETASLNTGFSTGCAF